MLASLAVSGADTHPLPVRVLALRMRWAACDVVNNVVITVKSNSDEGERGSERRSLRRSDARPSSR
jgi:hypothetical protein